MKFAKINTLWIKKKGLLLSKEDNQLIAVVGSANSEP